MSLTLLSATFVLATTLGCAISPSPARERAADPWRGRAGADLTVRVENNHYEPVRVTAVWDRLDYFLGEIPANSAGTFRLPGYLLESHGGPRFLADPRGSAQDQLTAPVDCVRARTVEWRLRRNFHPSRPIVF